MSGRDVLPMSLCRPPALLTHSGSEFTKKCAVLTNTNSHPASSALSKSTDFSVPFVATATNPGVRTDPFAVDRTPVLASDFEDLWAMWSMPFGMLQASFVIKFEMATFCSHFRWKCCCRDSPVVLENDL